MWTKHGLCSKPALWILSCATYHPVSSPVKKINTTLDHKCSEICPQKKNRARRLAKKINTTEAWRRFRKHRNEAVSAVRAARRDYFSTLLSPIDVHNLSSSTTKVPITISNGVGSASYPGAKATLFNDYFATCFIDHGSIISNTNSHPAPRDASSLPLGEITCDWTDVVGAIKRLKHLKHNTVSGPDGISATMLKRCCSSICGRLACLFNASFFSVKVPAAWKTANVTPIHKKGDISLVQNYRPISLLSLVGKLQETCP